MKFVLQPASSSAPQKHYRETIERRVSLAEIQELVPGDVLRDLETIYPSGDFVVWGATPGQSNDVSFARISTGDQVLFYARHRFFSTATVTYARSGLRTLAKALWGTNSEGKTWELVFFLEDVKEIDVSYGDVWDVIQRGPKKMLRGLTVLSQDQSAKVDGSLGLSTTITAAPIIQYMAPEGLSRAGSSPLVLVENEETYDGDYDFWEDETGVRYQYPNQYRNKVQTGRPFVYYRGVRRGGGKRASPEYFGIGTVGEVWRDPKIPEGAPKRQWRWYCAIEEYQSFVKPVPAKQDEKTIEPITNPLGWRTGVREIPWSIYNQILERAGLSNDIAPEVDGWVQGELEEVVAEDLLVLRPKDSGGGGGGREGTRRSTQSKWIGDQAEEAVRNRLMAILPADQAETIDWHAERGNKPGYDLSYRNETGELIGVEVKGTTLSRFASVELTRNEWRAASEMGSRFRIALVSRVGMAGSQIAFLDDPFGLAERGHLSAVPNAWRICGVTG